MNRRVLLAVVVTAVVLSGLGLLAPQVIRSPAQVAAERDAPDLPVLTAEVERRVLSDTVVVRGTVTTRRGVDVVADPPPGRRAVVTALPVRSGDQVRSGQVLVEVSGRPVLLLEGALPAYRDLGPGDTGPDVEQLQDALRGLGHAVGDADGRWGRGTTAAVRSLYRARGYPPGPGGGLPMSEVVFLSGLPGRVSGVDVGVGDRVDDTVMKVASGSAVVTARLVAGDRDLVRAGQRVRIASESLGLELRGEVVRVGRSDGGPVPTGVPLTVRPLGEVDRRLLDRDVLITVVAARSKGKELVVPLSAVTAQADGTSVVRVRRRDGSVLVPVRLGLVAGGHAAVRPVGDARLDPGEHVVVGADGRTGP